MKKLFIFSIIVFLMVLGLSQSGFTAPEGSARIRLVVVSPGLNVLVEKWGPDFLINPSSNSIFDNTTGNPYGFKVENIGDQNFTISMSITNAGGATLVTTGNPGAVLTGSSDIRIAAVFCEWDTTLTVSDFGSEDVLSSTLLPANTTSGALHYPGATWAIGVDVAPTDVRPVAFSIDAGAITPGTSYDVDVYVEVN